MRVEASWFNVGTRKGSTSACHFVPDRGRNRAHQRPLTVNEPSQRRSWSRSRRASPSQADNAVDTGRPVVVHDEADIPRSRPAGHVVRQRRVAHDRGDGANPGIGTPVDGARCGGSEPGRVDANAPLEPPGCRKREPVEAVAKPGVRGFVLGLLEVGGPRLDLGDEGGRLAGGEVSLTSCCVHDLGRRARGAVPALVGARAALRRGWHGWLAVRSRRPGGRPRWRRGAGGRAGRGVLHRRVLAERPRQPPRPSAGRSASGELRGPGRPGAVVA